MSDVNPADVLMNSIGVDTGIEGDRIIQHIWRESNGIRETITRQLFDVAESQVRDALITLGWTPPSTPPAAQDWVCVPREMLEEVSDILCSCRDEDLKLADRAEIDRLRPLIADALAAAPAAKGEGR